MGSAGYDVVWGPLLRGKFGTRLREIAMPWFWARVHDRTAELGYLRGGFQRLYNRLAERCGAGRDRGSGTVRCTIGQDRSAHRRPDGRDRSEGAERSRWTESSVRWRPD